MLKKINVYTVPTNTVLYGAPKLTNYSPNN